MNPNGRKETSGGSLGERWKSAFKSVKSLGFQLFDKETSVDESDRSKRGSIDSRDRSRKNSLDPNDTKRTRRKGSIFDPVLLDTHHLVELTDKSRCHACDQPVGGKNEFVISSLCPVVAIMYSASFFDVL